MVPRLALITAAALLVAPASAGAVSRKVAIGDFQWTPPQVTIDRGDSVTWYWVGPDTQHSITGLSQNATQWDSDPGNAAPDHGLGDQFKVTFDQPGVYQFHCKLHAIVRGEVIVTDQQGTGGPSPDPDPAITEDVTPPELTDVRWSPPTMRAGKGAELKYTLDEPSKLVFDVMQGNRLIGTRRFIGHIGWNTFDFKATMHGRKLKPGKYRALLVAIDGANNHTGDHAAPFRVKKG